MIVYICVSMGKRQLDSLLGMMRVGVEEYVMICLKRGIKENRSCIRLRPRWEDAKCIETHDLGEWEECKAV